MPDSGDTGALDSAGVGACEQLGGSGCRFVTGTPQAEPCLADVQIPVDTASSDGQLGGGGCGCDQSASIGWLSLVVAAVVLLRRFGPFVVVVVLATVSPGAFAADAQQVTVLDGGAFPVLREADLGAPWSPRIAIGGTYAHRPVVLRGDLGARPVLDGVLTRELGLSLNIAGPVRVGLSIPHHQLVLAHGEDLGGKPADVGFWLAVPLSAYGPDARRRIAWYVHTDFATGADELFLGDTGGSVLGMFAASSPVGPFEGVANLGVRLQRKIQLPGLEWGPRIEYGLGLRAEPFGPTWATVELQGSAPFGFARRTAADFPAEVVATFGTRFLRFFGVSLGGGAGLTQGFGSPEFRVLAVLDFSIREAEDSDGDGVADNRDLCRLVPEDVDHFRDGDGCPDPDNDRDGVLDAEDDCSLQPEIYNGLDDFDGCPDFKGQLEVVVHADVDVATVAIGGGAPKGVFPDEPVRQDVFDREVRVQVGAPRHKPHEEVVVFLERDLHKRLVVEMEPLAFGEVRVHLVDPTGAPVVGFVDRGEGMVEVPAGGAVLALPAGPARLQVHAAGFRTVEQPVDVPADARAEVVVALEPTVVRVSGNRVEVRGAIRFALDSDEVTAASRPLLDDVASFLLTHPEIELLRIEGHADEVGNSRYNYDLSVRRAAAVRAYLEREGVGADRLQAMGTGEARAEGRTVEMLVIVWDDDPK